MLLSSEDQWVALLEVVKDLSFVIQLLRRIKIYVKPPVIVSNDDVKDIFMASNSTTMSCTKHIYIRYKYVNEYVEDETVKIFLSLLKMTDIFTKNLNAELHEDHSKKVMGKKLE